MVYVKHVRRCAWRLRLCCYYKGQVRLLSQVIMETRRFSIVSTKVGHQILQGLTNHILRLILPCFSNDRSLFLCLLYLGQLLLLQLGILSNISIVLFVREIWVIVCYFVISGDLLVLLTSTEILVVVSLYCVDGMNLLVLFVLLSIDIASVCIRQESSHTTN